MKIEELTFGSIDAQRHLITSQDVVAAVAFAVRNAWSDKGAYRFVTALVMTDKLTADRREWYAVMRQIAKLTMEERELTS